MMYYNDFFFSPFHFLFAVIGWILVIMVILWIVRRLTGHNHRLHRRGLFQDSGMEVLRERYAKGEINKEEYEEKRKVLMHE